MKRLILGAFLVFGAIVGYTNVSAAPATSAVIPQAQGAALVKVTPVSDYAWSRPVIRVEDHTGARWSVDRAVSLWSQGTGLRLQSAPCVASLPCIRLYQGRYGKTGWAGQTVYDTKRWTWRGDTWTMRGVTVIQFNDTYSYMTRAQRDDATCHELGHALGVGKHSPSRSCMFGTADGRWTSPSTADRAGLRLAYRGVR